MRGTSSKKSFVVGLPVYPSKVNKSRLVPFPKPHDEATER